MNRQHAASPDRPDRVRDVVRDLVAEFAPDETPILDEFKELSDAEALRRLKRRIKRREPLGFGVEDLLPLLTPVLWIALTTVIETAVGGGTKAVGRKIRERFGRKPLEAVPQLTREQIDDVCSRVRAELIGKGFEEADAHTITEALRSRLKKSGAPRRGAVEE